MGFEIKCSLGGEVGRYCMTEGANPRLGFDLNGVHWPGRGVSIIEDAG